MAQQPTYLADFHGYPIEIIDRHGQPWLTGEQIGLALGLKHPRRGINKIYNAHRDEFTPEMTTVTETVTVTGPKETRIFSPRGAWMLGMWCQTERAKDFRKWVLDVLEGHQRPPANLAALRREALRANPAWRNIARYKGLGLSNVETGKLLGLHESTIRRHLRRMEACGLIAPPADLARLQAQARRLEGGAA